MGALGHQVDKFYMSIAPRLEGHAATTDEQGDRRSAGYGCVAQRHIELDIMRGIAEAHNDPDGTRRCPRGARFEPLDLEVKRQAREAQKQRADRMEPEDA
jgi:hypothetical protein